MKNIIDDQPTRKTPDLEQQDIGITIEELNFNRDMTLLKDAN